MRSIENISEELFDKIRSRVANIKLGNSEGVVTTDPSQARFFEFNFKHENPNEDFNSYNSNGFEIPQNNLQLNFKYNLN